MKILWLVLYIVVSAIHLYHSWKDDANKRRLTKPFLLVFLILFYLFSAKQIKIFLLLALIFSWLGDVLLIPKGHGWFTAGGISFLFSHIFFILTYTDHILYENVVWLIVIPAAILYYAVALLIIRALKDTTPKPMVVPMYLYLIANSTMNLFALMQLFSHRNGAAWVAFIGAVLFYISDCTLFLVRYYKKNQDLIFKKHFTVMATYLAGELLIVLGVLGLAG